MVIIIVSTILLALFGAFTLICEAIIKKDVNLICFIALTLLFIVLEICGIID